MISQKVIDSATQIRDSFGHAKPFRYVMIESFLESDAAEALLRDFPRFDERKAINEHGEVGRKAVVERVTAVSAFYAQFYDYINSKPFLEAMSKLTGIPDLIADPTLFGGGTHENLEGQGLNVHVDFNVDERRMLHRRINLLIYLNKDWDSAWGGDIELHSNPWYPEADQVKAFPPLFNHGLIFETNEYSWHGFQRIALPDNRKHLSRKSFSIYLYTKDRPAEEIVAPHTTFYVPEPLPDSVVAGATLTAADAQAIRIATQSRDGLIRMYQKLLVEKEQRLRDFISAAQQHVGAGGDHAIILGSRSWRLIMALHRMRYALKSTVRKLKPRGR